jgi:hypothetical protein|tara:strand:- start:443 stop:622 length:180 start_codon:yes stop_codon:yes gene_type:complete
LRKVKRVIERKISRYVYLGSFRRAKSLSQNIPHPLPREKDKESGFLNEYIQENWGYYIN